MWNTTQHILEVQAHKSRMYPILQNEWWKMFSCWFSDEPFSCLPNILKCWQQRRERRLTNSLVERADDDLDIIICPAHKVYCDDAYIHVLWKGEIFLQFRTKHGFSPQVVLIPEYILRESEWKNAIYFSKYEILHFACHAWHNLFICT